MKTYTICGSMQFAQEMHDIALYLETVKGYNVLQCIYTGKDTYLSPEHTEALKNAHYKKIDLSDGIFVVNLHGHIGTSTKEEIEYATKQGKEILYYC